MIPRAHTVLLLPALVMVVGCGVATSDRLSAIPMIHYEDVGTGPPVVFVHGFTQTHKAWHQIPVYENLKADHRLISVDLRGHGDSPKPHAPRRYGKHMADDLVRLLDKLGLEEAHFVGFSLGASVIGEVIVSHPDRVLTATLGSGYFTQWDESEELFAKSVLERGASNLRFPWEPENQDFRALAAVVRGARFAEVSAQDIARVSTPTLVVFGSLELDAMSPDQRETLQSLPDSIQLLTIEGADHDSEKAAVLSAEFTDAVRVMVESGFAS